MGIARIAGWTAIGVVIAGAIGVGAMWIATSGEYAVPATVADDTSLPAIDVDGVRLHAESFGKTGDPVIVVLHGGPGSDYASLLGLKALRSDYQVVFYDQRGAGLSARVPAEKLTLDGYFAELDGVIATYSPDRPVHLIGHSWGAMLAAAYLGKAPEKIASAILMEPGFFDAAEFADWSARASNYMSGLGMISAGARAVFESLHIEGPDDAAANDYLYGKMVDAFANHPDNPYHCQGEPYDAPHWRFGARASKLASETSGDEIDRIAAGARAYDGPVLLMAGACDTWLGAELQTKHQAYFADAALKVIPNAGHELVWDNERATLAAVSDFLSARK